MTAVRICGVLILLLGSAALAADPPAKGAKGADNPAEATGNAIAELATAAELAAFGRGELNDATGLEGFKSAEALVAAGGILLRVHKASGGKLAALDVEVADGDGKAVAGSGKVPSLEAEAQALFDEARALADKNNTASVEALIKKAETAASRGAIGGPRCIVRSIQSGKVHTIRIPFEANSPATVSMRGTGRTQFEVVGQGGNTLWHSKGSWGTYSWNTGGGPLRIITVKVINKGGPAVTYNITTN